MAAPRVSHQVSDLFHLVRACRPTTHQSLRQNPSSPWAVRAAFLHSSSSLQQETFPQRYGSATEPRFAPPAYSNVKILPPLKQDAKQNTPTLDQGAQNRKDGADDMQSTQSEGPKKDVVSDAARITESSNPSAQDEVSEAVEEKPATPLDIVLQMPPPSEIQAQNHKHPHLAPSPYEHHFDTYSLVRELVKGDLTDDQAVTIMKAIRLMLAENLDMAKDGLVSRSDVENETYLFRAACSELRTSLQSSRHSEIQTQRTQRAQLHHEFDILNQNVSQDMLSLREELKAMFNDRKMAVQEEKQRADSKISELNYEITVLLNSDCKSEVEGLRWVLTRRAAMAIAIAACKFSHLL